MRFDIITPFPEAFSSYLGVSILKRAIERRLVSVRFTDPRKFSKDRHRTIDGKPYGGGAGMVLMAEPILKAVERLRPKAKGRKTKVVVLSAKGKQFSQKMAYDWAKRCERLVLVSGRYEGIDERVGRILRAEEVSVGPYVLTDGDVAAMAVISAVARLIPGVIREESLHEESHRPRRLMPAAGSGTKGLEYPQYTRPAVLAWRGKRYAVPRVLLGGDHGAIRAWREQHRH